MPKRMEGRRLKVLLYVHAVLQVISVSIATVGAILAVKHLENKFDNTHQRIGLAVYALIWLQPLTALCRPRRGVRGRTVWYFLHWILGTGASLLGIIDIYIGLYAYRSKTSNSVTIWIILFTVEVSCVAFLYLLQDRWDYLYKQGLILELEPLGPTHQVSPLRNKMNGGHC
ncbi:Cytochrome b561 domain-containing protein [Nymphaea thermarum]|nr:Cytochrome b561 domain-containing protein [Nymphaea thermarum]